MALHETASVIQEVPKIDAKPLSNDPNTGESSLYPYLSITAENIVIMHFQCHLVG